MVNRTKIIFYIIYYLLLKFAIYDMRWINLIHFVVYILYVYIYVYVNIFTESRATVVWDLQ